MAEYDMQQLTLPNEDGERAKEYMKKHTAANELKAWALQPDTGIDYKGRGTHKLYILRPETDRITNI